MIFQRHQPDLVQRDVRQVPESLPDVSGLLHRPETEPVRIQRRTVPCCPVHRWPADHLLQVRAVPRHFKGLLHLKQIGHSRLQFIKNGRTLA